MGKKGKINTHIYLHKHTYTHTVTHTHAHPHTHTSGCTMHIVERRFHAVSKHGGDTASTQLFYHNTHLGAHTHKHTQTNTHTHTLTHTNTHSLTLTHTHRHTLTHTHSHISRCTVHVPRQGGSIFLLLQSCIKCTSRRMFMFLTI